MESSAEDSPNGLDGCLAVVVTSNLAGLEVLVDLNIQQFNQSLGEWFAHENIAICSRICERIFSGK